MSKPFNIHDWQAKQRQQLLNEGEIGTDVPFGGSRGRSPEWLDAEVTKYIGLTFASWMSPDNPPFHQAYAKPPYIDKLVKGIMDIVNSRDVTPIAEEHGNSAIQYYLDQFTRDVEEGGRKGGTEYLNDVIKAIANLRDTFEYYDDKVDPGVDLEEMNTTGTGASFQAGAGEGYMTPKAFKKKRKED